MQGIRFYLEFPSRVAKRASGSANSGHAGNVFAVFACNGPNPINHTWEGLGGIYEDPNSPVASTAAAPDFLRTQCKRIGEVAARTIHPALFEHLDKETKT